MPQTLRRATPKTAPRGLSLEPEIEPYPEIPEEPAGPKVSAIIVSYNRAAALRRAIEALERSQSREQLEILVVDCGSQDESRNIDAEYPGIDMLRLPHHFGATKAMNIGTRTAKSELVFYLSPEVEVSPDTIVRLAERLAADPDAVAACPLLVDADGRPVSRIQKIPTPQSLAAACRGDEPALEPLDLTADSIAVEYPGIDALMVRRQFVKGMNYFDERYGQFWADADLAMQAYRAQKKIQLYPGIRVAYRAEPDPLEGDPLLKADCALGAAVFVGKYNGFMAGLGFRLAAIFRALARLDLRQVTSLVSGQKLDGSQAG